VEAGLSLRLIVLSFFAAMALIAAGPAQAQERRVALVIGNGAYTDIPVLRNPVNDARLIRDTLTGLGFDVIYRENADRPAMERAINAFSARLFEAGPEGVGLFYFAGHGVASGGENFLLPIDVSARREADLRIAGLRAGDVLAQMDGAGSAVKIAILDACRDNPFADTFRSARNARGLAQIGLGNTEFFVAYAATSGNVAEDGRGANSPYATALARRLATADSDLDNTFRLVRVDVSNITGNRQIPESTSTMRRQFYFRRTSGASIVAAPAPADPIPTTAPPANFRIEGQWCQTSRGRAAIALTISSNTLIYTLDDSHASYAVRSIARQHDGTIEVHWINRGEEVVFQFGDFSADGAEMTQLRGRQTGDPNWRDYGIRLRRC
jgi:hypothetical protein